MTISVVGKQSFVSKKGTQCNILHVLQPKQNVQGYAASTIFVDDAVYQKAALRTNYDIVYDCNDFGRAIVRDIIPVSNSASHE